MARSKIQLNAMPINKMGFCKPSKKIARSPLYGIIYSNNSVLVYTID